MRLVSSVARRVLITPVFRTTAPVLHFSKMSEVEKVVASLPVDDAPGTFFDKIIDGTVPADIVYQDDEALAFRDIAPQAPTHVLVIPKKRSGLTQLTKATPEHKLLLGHLMYVASEVARMEGLSTGGCRFVVNDGVDGCQSVYHLHIHVLGGRKMGWPPG
mmetsp:Transcript_79278/g.158322  ORF Transcript_79278/g.158322 Transcript_79278/m.158322 type:complete len:160 (-) Transcript_79278:40-519(-)